MKRLILAAALIAAFATPALAADTGCKGRLTAAEWQRCNEAAKPAPAAPSPAPAAVVAPTPPPAPPALPPPPTVVAAPVTPAPAPSPVTVSSGPGGETTVSVGTIAGQVLNWILITFSVPIGGYAVFIINRVFANLKIPMTDAARAKLKEIVVNGLNLAAPAIQAQLAGQGNIAIKNATVAQAVVYAQKHGADTIKTLGLDPTSPEAVEALKAWAETAIADPSVPTPAILDPAPAKPAADAAAPAKT